MKIITRTFHIIFLVLLFQYSAYSEQLSIVKGTVTKIDSSPLAGVLINLNSVTDKLRLQTESSDSGKFFFENVKPGTYNIKASLTGFKYSEKKNITISEGDTLNITFTLDDESYTTEEIDVVSDRFRQAQNDMRTSLLNLSPYTSKILPGVGEDVLRSLQTLPGVSAPNDFSSQLIVRGSGPDQNLIIMDDVEIFNPYRLYGVFSMFNPETLDQINLITGGFPSKYGDRLSAVLDVTNKEGERKKYFTGVTNINIANANLVFSGKLPLKGVPGAWIISSRRSYYDLILGPFAKKSGLIDESASFPSFQDVQAKITFGPFKNNKFYINGVYSKDGVDIIPGNSKELKDSVSVRDLTRNDVLAASWMYAPSKHFLSKTTFSWYRNKGDADFGGSLLDPVLNSETYDPNIRDSLRALGLFFGINFSSKYTFRKYSLVNNMVFLSKNHRLELGGGVDILKTDIEFSMTIDPRLQSIFQNNPNFSALDNAFIEGKNYWRYNVYAQDRIKISPKFFVQPGLRADYFDIIKKPYLSPRVNFSYGLDKVTTLRFGTGVYYQSPGYEKLVDGQVFYDLAPDIAKNLKAERALHFILGIDHWFTHELNAKIETYFKKFDNLVVQESKTGHHYEFYLNDPGNTDPAYLHNPDNWTRSPEKIAYDSLTSVPINGAKGYSYGIEFYLEKKATERSSRLTGWISYSLSWANKNTNGLITPFKYDQRHSINIVASYRALNWLELGARFNLSSNFAYTKPVGVKPRVIGDSLAVYPVINQVQFDFDFGGNDNKMSSRKPIYHRLDIRATAYTKFWNIDWAFYLDVINVYNHKNVVGYDFYIDDNLKAQEKAIGQFPILPTIGINARF